MFLWYFVYFLVATLPSPSLLHHADSNSSQSLWPLTAGFSPSNEVQDYGHSLAQKPTLDNSNAENQKIVGSKEEKFVAKHLWDPTKHNDKSSFEYFKSNPDNTKAYFIDLNQKMYRGNILPNHQQLATKKGYYSKITIVDTNIKNIHNGGITEHGQNPQGKVYLTNDIYTMTQITGKFEDDNLVFKAAKLKGHIELGLDGTGKNIVHLEKPHEIGIETIHKTVNLATFSLAELNNIENGRVQIQDGLKKDFKKLKTERVLINVNHPKFKNLQEKVRRQCRTGFHDGGSRCAISINQNGDVENIFPKEFVDAYKLADKYGKQILAELAMKNKDKIISTDLDDDIETEKMNKLLELEQTKSHVKDLNTIDDALWKSGSRKSDKGPTLDGTAKKLAEVDSSYKISHSKVAHSVANYKAAKALANGVSKANSFLSIFFTAKTLVNGIKSNDTTSLAIVGAQLGFNALTNSVVAAGTKYSKHVTKQLTKAVNAKDWAKISKLGNTVKTGSKVGKTVKLISDVAGPIGIVADVGLSAWSMSKSVSRLLNATNKYERNAAIANIVGDAIDIAVTAVVTAISLFPPAAPFAIAAGIIINLLTQLSVALFQAGNEVARINAEVPLLDFEKNKVFRSRFFDWFGTRKPDYIDNLVEEKKANDIAVQHSLEILKNNIEILGIVVPSRTLKYEGSCVLTNRYCKLKRVGGCTKWETEYTVGTGCDYERPCGNTGRKCEDSKTNHGKWGYNEKKCTCSGTASTTFGSPRKNSLVDFRNKQGIYWERSVPKDVENAVFQCKPGSSSFLDYKVHQQNQRNDFLCENAIGILQPYNRRKPGQAMLFVLEDGKDDVYLNQQDTKASIFLMGDDGIKNFNGGGGSDEFIFDSTCSRPLTGYLDGNIGDDSITLGNNCTQDRRITIDFKEGRLVSESNNLNLNINGIENINGRKDQGETFTVACTTRRVTGHGGSSTKLDEIRIPIDSNCKYNVTIFSSSHTKISSKATTGVVTLVFDQMWTQLQVELDVYPQKQLQLNLFFIKTSSGQLTNVAITKDDAHHFIVQLETSALNQLELKLNIEPDVNDFSIRFAENPANSPDSVLFLSMKTNLPTLFFHNLPDLKENHFSTRMGCMVTENIFEISGSLWHVSGGDLNDEFILHTNNFGNINGNGGIDSIKIGQDFSKPVNLDLVSGKIKSIENVLGVPGVPMIVKTSCDTLLVAPKGGSKITPDLITIPKKHCDNRNLRIVVEGHVHVVLEDRKRNDNDTVQIIASGNDEFQLELETKSTEIGNAFVVIPTSSKSWSVINAQSNDHQINVHLKDKQTEDWIKLNLKFDVETKDTQYLQSPYIQIFDPNSTQIPGVLVLEKSSGIPKIIYDLRHTQNESVVEGFVNIKNIFILGTSEIPWSVTGGNVNDEFLLQVKSSEHVGQHTILGGGNDNTLILECGEENHENVATFVVNLLKNEFGFLNTLPEEIGIIDSIQNVVGRPGAQDIFHANCNTSSLNGHGGRSEGNENDLIRISDQDCDYNLLTIVPGYTTVINNAKKGEFVYYITNLSTTTLEMQPTQHNKHLLKFSFHPWEVIKAVAFNETTQELGLKISNGENETMHGFKLWASSESSEYVNPVFEFSPAGSSVSSDIRVSTDGVTMATFLVEGLQVPDKVYGLPVDVNRFLINITSGSDYSSGTIQGCSDGLRCSANQFWIFNLESTLDILDGGNCQENNCTNYLFFPTNLNERKLHFDLDTENGRVTTGEGEIVISQLKNIHELHGSKGISAKATCSTTHVSKLDAVMITEDGCQSDLIIGVEPYTRVIFQDIFNDDISTTSTETDTTTMVPNIDENDDDAYNNYEYDDGEMDEEYYEPDDNGLNDIFNNTFGYLAETNFADSYRTVHYRFAHLMSFDPEGPLSRILSVDHIYYLPFDLNDLGEIDFNVTEQRLHYTVDNIECSHKMVSPLYFWEQFYSQPSFLTNDGYSLQVARDGSLWATLGNASSFNEISQESMPYLQETAINLEITMIIQSPDSFYYIGHSGTKNDDRNVVQNDPEKVSHLAGGGANDAIYDILSLDTDVFIYTGYDEDSYISWESNVKQTIDLTDIVVPIRNLLGTKFVPKTTTNGNNLVISMQGYEEYFPGKVIIVNGAFPWVAKRIQLILSGAVMDFMSDEDDATNLDEETTTADSELRNKRSVEGSNERNWAISPRPLIIPADVNIYSISTEDLEDGQDIRLESSTNQENIEDHGTFQVVRNGSDLYMTNAVSSNLTAIKAVIINDFWQSDEMKDDVYERNKDAKVISGVTVRLPGLNLVLNESSILRGDIGNLSSSNNVSSEASTVTFKYWDQALYEFEGNLLEDMPDIPRTFSSEECLPWWEQQFTKWVAVLSCGILSIFVMILGGFKIFKKWKKGYYKVPHENIDEKSNMEMMQLAET